MKGRKGSSFKTALNNHPLVKQMKQVEEVQQNNYDTKNIKINLGTFEKKGSSQKSLQPTMGVRRKESEKNLHSGRHYGRDFEEDEFYVQSQSYKKNKNSVSKIRLEDVEPYLDEIDDLEEDPVKPKKLQIFTSNTNEKNYSTPIQKSEKRQWEPLQQNQRQNEIEQVQKKIQEKKFQREAEEDRIYDFEMAKPMASSKVKSVVNMLNKEPKKGKENLRSVMTISDEERDSRFSPPPRQNSLAPQSQSFGQNPPINQNSSHHQNQSFPQNSSHQQNPPSRQNPSPHQNQSFSQNSLIHQNSSRHQSQSFGQNPPVNQNSSHHQNQSFPQNSSHQQNPPSRQNPSPHQNQSVGKNQPFSQDPSPPHPAPQQNLLIKANLKSPKTSVNLSTDAFHHQEQDSGDFPPPPPQLFSSNKDTTECITPPEVIKKEEKTGEECLAEEADLLLQFLKSNWQIVDYLEIRIPRDVINRMNRLPRKIVVLKEASEVVKAKKGSRRLTKRLGKRGKAKYGLQKRAIERVASLKSDEIHRIVDEQSTLRKNKNKNEDQFYSRSLQREESFPDRIQYQSQKIQQIPTFEQKTPMDQEQVYEDSKWNIIKKGGRFVKKSAAALITRKQSPTPLSKPSNNMSPLSNHNGIQSTNSHKTESRIQAEIQNLKEREDELRRHRVAMGLPTVDDLIGHWKHPDPRLCPLRETRSFNHLKVNMNEQKNWPPTPNGHYAMTKSESFHHLHQFHPQHSNQNSVGGKYLRNGEIPGAVNGQPCWVPADRVRNYFFNFFIFTI